MFEPSRSAVPVPPVALWAVALADADLEALDDTARIDLIRALEELKCAAEGAQAHATADFEKSQREVAEQTRGSGRAAGSGDRRAGRTGSP